MIITTADAPAAIGPYVQGVNLGAMTITSGQLPINPLDGTMPARYRRTGAAITGERESHRRSRRTHGRADR